MKVAHLVSYYKSNALYRSLFNSLDDHGLEQFVYSPRGIPAQPELSLSITVRSTNLWRKLDRFLFQSKIKKYEKWLDGFIPDDQPDVLHAHTLYSDGFVAYQMSKKYNIPYVVTVRGTDVNIFAKYFYHLRPAARKVLESASQIVFINNVTKPKLQNILNFNFDSNRVAVMPNGMSEFWINSERPRKPIENTKTVRVVCVAKVIKLKNHRKLIKSILELNKSEKQHYQLTVVGDYSNEYGLKIKNQYESEQIKFVGVLKPEEIRRYFWSSDIFAMPSHTETFGIVYLEALSQGLPILYSKNQGFDGWDVNNCLGVSCDSQSIEDISLGLRKLTDRKLHSGKVVSEVKRKFSWKVITVDLITIYNKTISN